MTFRDDAQFDPDLVPESGGGGGGRMLIGGGIGTVVLIAVTLLLGGDPGSIIGQLTGGDSTHSPAAPPADCKTGAQANRSVDCRIRFTMQSLNNVWTVQLPKQTGKRYQAPHLSIFNGAVNTRCGRATSAVGPFYCPADHTAYFDAGFFQVLTDRFGASDGPLAQEYVVAHEVGHSVQKLLGTIGRAQADPRGRDSGAVRTELQADCYAGVWAHYAAVTPAPGGREPLLHPLTDAQVNDALSAASAVGDDRIQESSTGRVNPESWTHGSSRERQAWFLAGYRTGRVDACDTYRAADLTNP